MADSPTVEITVDGKHYSIQFEDFNALDAKAFRQEVGTGLAAAFADSPDLDTMAGLLWIYRRKTNPKLKFEDVARGLTYTSIEVLDAGETDESESDSDTPGDDDPEA